MTTFWTEVWQVLRGLLARPAFLVVTVITLGLGIGANTAIFSAVDKLLIKGIPYPDSDRLVMLWSDGTERGFAQQDVVNPGVMMEWEKSLTSIESIGGIDFWNTTLVGTEGAELVRGAEVSWRFFETLGVPMAMGRSFTEAEDVENGPRVAIASHQFWQNQMGGDPNVLGSTISLNEEPWTVVGILPEGFSAPSQLQARLFKPLQGSPEPDNGFFLPVIARLKPGVTIEQADAELDGIQANLAAEYHGLRQLSGYVQPLQEVMVQNVSAQLWVLLGATFFVLLIACANIANLLLARAVSQARELAIRSAIGASRGRIMRRVLIESTLLSVMGMVLGIVLAWFGLAWISAMLPTPMAEANTLAIDARVMGFALAIALGTGLIAGSVPAWLASRREASEALRSGGRGMSDGREGKRLRGIFVAGTFALSLALTVTAGLFLKSLVQILDVDPGFEPEGLLTFTLRLSENRYEDGDAMRAFEDLLRERLLAIPGAEKVGFTSTLPMGDLITDTGTAIDGVPLEGNPYRTWYSRVSSGYLDTLGVERIRGRDFDSSDHRDGPCVVLASESYVARYLGSREPVGTRILLAPNGAAIPCEIVGLYRDLRFNGLAAQPDPTIYLPTSHFANRRFFVVLRSAGEAMNMLPSVRQAIAEIDPGMAVWSPVAMETLVSESVRTSRQVAALVGAFALLSLLLAASGVYGVVSYNVNSRMREFGVRTALGANRYDLLRLVLVGGLWLVGSGMAAGVALTVFSGRLLSNLLYEVQPFDLQVFGSVSLILILSALLAMMIPARRAAQVQPMEALRYE